MDIEKEVFEDAQDILPKEFEHMSTDSINQRARLLENEIRVLKDESTRLSLDQNGLREKIKENKEKIKLNNQLPYLVGNIVEVLDIKPEEEEEEDGATADIDAQRQGKCVVLKTSTRQTIFLPVVGLVDANTLRPGDLVGVNKDRWDLRMDCKARQSTGSVTCCSTAQHCIVKVVSVEWYCCSFMRGSYLK
jgi:26S proteasome regulatory subunit T5